MKIQPYLHFDGCCEEALKFYCKTLGAEMEMLMRYKESPEPPPPGMVPPEMGDKVMHASLHLGDTVLMASDNCMQTQTQTQTRFEGFQLTLTVADAAAAARCFAALAEGGQVRLALAPTFYSPSFGMLTDRFGVAWMVMAMPQ